MGTRKIIWWTFRSSGDTLPVPPGEARDLLRKLAERHATPILTARHIQQSFGGIIGVANDRAKREGITNAAQLYARFKSRFATDRDLPNKLLEDPDFDTWLKMRASELED